MKSYKEFLKNLIEDRFSPTRKHAIFIVGGPGSGKSFFASHLGGLGLTSIDSDIAFEHSLKKSGKSLNLLSGISDEIAELRNKAKRTTAEKLRLATDNGNGIIISATGKNAKDIQDRHEYLKRKGYKTHLLFVHTSNEESRRRNVNRGVGGGRSVPEEIRQKAWDSTHQNKETFKQMFGDNYREFDNENPHSDDKNAFNARVLSMFKHYRKVLVNPKESETMSEIKENYINNKQEERELDYYEKLRKDWEHHAFHKNEYYDILE